MVTTAVCSFIFPDNLKYFKAFIQSLQNQTKKDFVLLLFVDGIDDIDEYLADDFSFSVHKDTVSGSIAEIRKQAFKFIKQSNFRKIVFADTDDILHRDRIKVCQSFLDSHAVVVNDIVPFSDPATANSRGYWESRLSNGYQFSRADILNYNFVGLGNTAVLTEVIKEFKVDEGVRALDWYLFSRWLEGYEGIFLHDGVVFYRQHPNNLAGAKRITEASLLNISEVKRNHYKALAADFKEFEGLLSKTELQYQRLMNDTTYRHSMADYINAKQINYFWWEETEYLK